MNARPISLFVVIAAALLLWPCAVEAEPIRVRTDRGKLPRFRRGSIAGWYGDRLRRDEPEAHGQLVECRTILRFKDGSLYDERRHSRRSESSGSRPTVSRNAAHPTRHWRYRSTQERAIQSPKSGGEGRQEEVASGKLEMPADLYNGMALMLLKNLPGGAGAVVHVAVFTPEPRLIEMEWSWEGEDEVLLGGRPMKTMRSLVKLKIGGLTGVFASLVGKSPPGPSLLARDRGCPAFVRFEGAMYLNGPVWRLR